MAGVFYELAFVGRRNAMKLGKDVHRTFMICGVFTLFIWVSRSCFSTQLSIMIMVSSSSILSLGACARAVT